MQAAHRKGMQLCHCNKERILKEEVQQSRLFHWDFEKDQSNMKGIFRAL